MASEKELGTREGTNAGLASTTEGVIGNYRVYLMSHGEWFTIEDHGKWQHVQKDGGEQHVVKQQVCECGDNEFRKQPHGGVCKHQRAVSYARATLKPTTPNRLRALRHLLKGVKDGER